jgi:hypothetical protein
VPYKNIEDRRAANLRCYHRLIQRLKDAKGGRCAECGRKDRALEIHHVKEDGKNAKRRKNRYKEYRRLEAHPEDYELLCVTPCHRTRTMKYVRSFGKGGSRNVGNAGKRR